MLDFLGNLQRTHMCGELRASDAGRNVILMGWINRRRDLGNLIFLDLRDRTGISQVVITADAGAELHKKAESLRSEYVVAVIGHVKLRDPNTINPNIPTGEIEVVADALRLLNDSKPLPFSPADNEIANEEVRLKYRYLDLRRPEMHENIALRHRVTLAIREYLNSQGFYEIETPMMTRSTPEGARDYLVPSRVHAGKFYALPQSPQQFTQIDLEMTFARPDTVFAVVEGFLTAAWKTIGVDIQTPFPRMTYDEAIRLYGIDKPDLRLPAMADVKPAFTPEQLATLNIDPQLPVLAIVTPKVGELSRKERDDLKLLFGDRKEAKVFEDIKRMEKSFPDGVSKIREIAKPNPDDLLVVVAASKRSEVGSAAKTRQEAQAVYAAAGQFRLVLGQKFAAQHGAFARRDFRFLWVTDFPMFEWDESEGRWNAAHHPFTSPHEEDMPILESDPGAARSLAYDVVLNGTELGSGSIRIHRQDIQSIIFKALGMSAAEQEARFGYFLEALQYGTPPHGGIALGLDRIVMILAGGSSL